MEYVRLFPGEYDSRSLAVELGEDPLEVLFALVDLMEGGAIRLSEVRPWVWLPQHERMIKVG